MTTKTDAVRPLTRFRIFAALSAVALAASFAFTGTARAETDCPANEGATAWPEYTADVVVLDTAMVFNRLGAQNPNWVMYALKRDVINIDTNLPLKAGGAAVPGRVAMRPDKRPRPLVLRVPRCSKLTIDFTNLLANPANPVQNLGDLAERLEGQGLEAVNDEGDGFPIVHIVDDQVKTRWAGVHVQGLELATSIADDSSYVGNNANSCVAQGAGPTPFTFLAEHEGAFKLSNPCAAIGGEASGGNNGLGMWGMVAVQPMGARIYRSQVYEEELRLAADADFDGLVDATTAQGHPVIDYEAIYPDQQPWTDEGKANLPILNMICNQEAVDAGANCNLREIVHSEINAIVAGPEEDGTFGSDTYPLENVGIRNPAYPTRLEPFRDFASMFHDETATHNAFEGFFTHPVLGHTLHGVRDAFMINYGSGGIGSEIIANRLGVGPMYDCLDCAYEEFFLTSFTVGDPGMRVDVPANFGLENVSPETVAAQDPALVPLIGPKATTALFQDDPANIHNSYTGDHAKVRNIHAGPKEQHIYHQHNHQWLFNPNDDRANYLDAQGIGPGSSYTYEYVYGGMGNRNKTAGDAIFHCHFYPHFAQGMWYHMRIHDVTETGTVLQASVVDFVDDDEDPETPEIRVPLAVPYHDDPFELGNSPPALVADTNAAGLTDVTAPAGARNRAHPDGEILAGIPISAVVPLPGKPMAPMPGDVVLVTKDSDGDGAADSSQNYVVERDINPGYPFWIAGVDCSNGVDGIFDPTCAQAIVGQRPTTPPLDMITQTEAAAALLEPEYENMPLPAGVTWQEYETAFVNAAGGFDGGLPRHALGGCKDSQPAVGGVPQVLSCTHAPALHAVGDLFESAETRLDFHKEVIKAKGVFYPESGTDLEKLAMGYQAQREHATSKINLDGTVVSDDPETPDVEVAFIVNGLPPVPGAPYQDPCVDDNEGLPLLSSANPEFFAADGFFYGADAIQDDRDWDNPFTYAAANIQIDAVFNKVGYHYPQQRIIALWGDVMDTINKDKAPEPFVMRLNSFNCAKYQHSNLVPKEFEVDDYQVRTPTDIIGQHIHLPKWDLTTADGAANGWNYEDGTLSPGMVVERIHAINAFTGALPGDENYLLELPHPALGAGDGDEWLGSRVTLQRWFVDPLVDRDGIDRGLGIVFTHDHYGPSTFQQIGLYSTLLAEPAESTWVHNETGVALGTRTAPNCGDVSPASLNCDGGPTSWQAAILPAGWSADPAQGQEAFREFYFEFSDFQHAYEAGVYVGAGPDGRPFTGGAGHPTHDGDGINTAFPVTANSFRHAINPSVRQQAICKGDNCPPGESPFPDIVRYPAVCDAVGSPRPCPEAINADDAGMLVTNYRNEPIGLRVFDPFADGPDGNPGTQTAGFGGDLAFALATPPLLGPDAQAPVSGPGNNPANFRAIPQMNVQPVPGPAGALAVGDNLYPPNVSGLPTIRTEFPDSENLSALSAGVPYNLQAALIEGDPYTPLARAFPGDKVTIKIQAGAHEHEHNATIHGVKWVQGNSGHGPPRPAAGWKNSQNAGISEQFNFTMPVLGDPQAKQPFQFDERRGADYLYTQDASQNGMWSGIWGLMRSYTGGTPDGADLFVLPDGFTKAPRIDNRRDFDGVCPDTAVLREYVVIADTANNLLDNVLMTTISNGKDGTPELKDAADELHVGGPLDPDGGTLVYNPREKDIPGNTIGQPNLRQGPLHDPTGLLFVLAEDLEPDPAAGNQGGACRDVTQGQNQRPGVANPACEVRLKPTAPVEPLVLRAAAGECVEARLFNRLTDEVPDLAGFNTVLPVVIRDRQAEPEGDEPFNSVTTFNNNLIRPSSYVGLHAQMVEYDITQHDGVVAGGNIAGGAVVGPAEGGQLAGAPFNAVTYRWYAGDVHAKKTGTGNQERVELIATAVEFGGSNLTPVDRIKQPQKGMIGALVVEPKDATWANSDGAADDDLALLEQVPNRQDGGATLRGTRADMVVTAGAGAFDDLVLIKQSGLNHRFRDGEAIPNIASEGQGIPEDAHDAGQKGANFGSEPAWFRFGVQPDANFGNAGAGPETLGGIEAEQMFSNVLNGDGPDGNMDDDDPWTPVFTATASTPTAYREARMRVLNPAGVGRGSTYDLHGHVWARDPYLPEDPTCLTAPSGLGNGTPLAVPGGGGYDCGLSSVKIGDNPLAWYLNGQESWTPMGHFDIVVESGGANGVTGDYLFRDHASFGVTDGIWGILRVEPPVE